jgi:enoyl-CoA hydratase/carnithine racemase
VLEVALHTDGGTLVFDGHTHEQFVHLFHAIGSDPENRVVILTGSGDAFMESISPDGFDFFTPQGYDKIFREGKKVLMNLLDIEAPMIAAVNGPVRLHSEYILLADIVLATPATVFQDKPHFEFGIVPGDGVNLLWQEAIGTIRGRARRPQYSTGMPMNEASCFRRRPGRPFCGSVTGKDDPGQPIRRNAHTVRLRAGGHCSFGVRACPQQIVR